MQNSEVGKVNRLRDKSVESSYRDTAETHEVINQTPPLEGVNLFRCDPVLREAVDRFGGSWASEKLHEYGAWCGEEMVELGFQANENLPQLKTHDRNGHRIDEIVFHPSYHRIMETGVRYGVHGLPWQDPGPGRHVAQAALYYLHHQSESGTGCPLTMTYAALPTLKPKFLKSAPLK